MSEEAKIDVNVPSNAKDLAFMYLGTASERELQYLEYLLTQFTKSKDQQIKDLTELLELAEEFLVKKDFFSYGTAKQSYQQKHSKP